MQPEPADPLGRAGRLHDVAKNEFALPPCVTSIDQLRHVLAADELFQEPEAIGGLCNRMEVELRGNDRQVRETPLAPLHVVFLRSGDFQQMADRGRKDVLIRLVVSIALGKAAERLGDVVRD